MVELQTRRVGHCHGPKSVALADLASHYLVCAGERESGDTDRPDTADRTGGAEKPRSPAGVGSSAPTGRALPPRLQREPADDRRRGHTARSISAADPLARRHVRARLERAPGCARPPPIGADTASRHEGRRRLLPAACLLADPHARGSCSPPCTRSWPRCSWRRSTCRPCGCSTARVGTSRTSTGWPRSWRRCRRRCSLRSPAS